MATSEYKVLITTSGASQRLGDLAKSTNPSLVRLLKKPILSHIVELYPKEVEIVVTVGYFGNLVKEFLKLAYPERKFTFVEVDKYQGEGSSQVYSMLKAKDQLNCPFIFHAGDTVVMESVPSPQKNNWVGGFKAPVSGAYSSFIELDDKVLAFNDRGSTDFDYVYIGLAGIKDYQKFWQILESQFQSSTNNSGLTDVPILEQLIKSGCEFLPQEFKTWLDIGDMESLSRARQTLGDTFVNLDKTEEETFLFDERFVIKFMANAQTVQNRIKRAEILKNLVPQVEGGSEHFYRYKYSLGRLYSRAVTPPDFGQFLFWAKENLWQESNAVAQAEFEKVAFDFYHNKTQKRLEQFYTLTGLKDEAVTINGEPVPALEDIFKKIDFKWLAQGKQTGFHGDFILDNIIRTQDGYKLLDWRQDFGGLMESGDCYYDLAKMNHNLTINHDMVYKNQLTIKVRGKVIFCDILRPDNLVNCQIVLHNFIKNQGMDLKKVKILTAIAWLNMSPLHHHPYNYFLYYFGKLNLWKAVSNDKN